MTRIFIENQELDINAELTNQITYSIDDIINIDSKSTSFTKTIIIPGTARNNKIFGNIFEFTNSNITDDNNPNVFYNYNASKSAKAMIEMNGLQVMKGVMRLMSIVVDGVNVEYEIVLFGELGGFVSALGNKRIEDIDFSAYDNDYNLSSIFGSWDSEYEYLSQDSYFTSGFPSLTIHGFTINGVKLTKIKVGDQILISGTATNNGVYKVLGIDFGTFYAPRTRVILDGTITNEHFPYTNINSVHKQYGSGCIYPLIDYGLVSDNKHDYSFRAFRPALFVREYMQKIINDAGYTYDSLFFDTQFFRRLIIPNNDIELQKRGIVNYVEATASQTYSESVGRGVQFDRIIEWNIPPYVNGFTYTSTDFESNYVTPITTKTTLFIQGSYKLSTQLYIPHRSDVFPYDITGYTTIWNNAAPPVQLRIMNDNGTILGTYEGFINGTINGVSAAPDYLDFNVSIDVVSTINNGEKIYVDIRNVVSGSYDCEFDIIIDNAQIDIKAEPDSFILYNYDDTIKINDTIPKNIYQKDFFTSIMKMFNLMVVEDKYKSKHLNIIPYIDFYDLTYYDDWSDKLNRAKPITIKPMSETNARYYEYNYKSDADFYNEQYKKKWNLIYGNRIFDNQLEFATENKKLEVIFSPSVLVGYDGEEKVVSNIYKKSNDIEEKIAHNIRIMQVKYINDIEEYRVVVEGSTYENRTDYLYAGHFDNPDLPNSDINFGATTELYFELLQGSLQNNLFNSFYSGYMAEITDKNSRLVTAEMYLTEKDIFNIDFSKFIYLDGALYRLIKIADWSVENLCKVELLRVVNTNYNNSLVQFPHVKICDSVWMSSNLNVSKYANGDEIPEITGATAWANATEGAWCYYDNDPANEALYGKLYNWYAINDPRGLAPNGWRVPKLNDFLLLQSCSGNDASKLASTDSAYWVNGAGTNELLFDSRGAGSRVDSGGSYIFNSRGEANIFWCSDNLSTDANWFSIDNYGTFDFHSSTYNKNTGYSIRLILA